MKKPPGCIICLSLPDLSAAAMATFIGESAVVSCAIVRNSQTIVVGEESGRLQFLRLVEADPTKPAIGEIKIRLLRREEPAT
jgi:hypothetical protein